MVELVELLEVTAVLGVRHHLVDILLVVVVVLLAQHLHQQLE
jgi:hypothetical protein